MDGVRLKVLATGTIALALLVGAGYLPGDTTWPLVAVSVVLLALFSIGWPRLMKLPSPIPVSVVIFLAGTAATLLGLMQEPGPSLETVAPVVAAGVILVFLTQLVRGTDAQKRLESVAVGISGMLVAAFGSGWVMLGIDSRWHVLGLVAGISMVGAAVPGMLRWPDRIVFPLGLVLAVLLGGAASLLDQRIGVLPALVLGAGCGLVVVAVRAMLVSVGGPKGTLQMAAAALAPLLVCGSLSWYVSALLL
ncbi:hypothetical protein GCM10025778_24070 [Paeniglutamicibacter antarcticus]|uniref:Permease n=1 Tax=Paeniglutamicibacter antarcticus TaxID=494023 RepID=A0ABP9TS08_9MICC